MIDSFFEKYADLIIERFAFTPTNVVTSVDACCDLKILIRRHLFNYLQARKHGNQEMLITVSQEGCLLEGKIAVYYSTLPFKDGLTSEQKEEAMLACARTSVAVNGMINNYRNQVLQSF
jgi:hypothetical protein